MFLTNILVQCLQKISNSIFIFRQPEIPLYTSLEHECRNQGRKPFQVRFTVTFLSEGGCTLLLHPSGHQTSAEDLSKSRL